MARLRRYGCVSEIVVARPKNSARVSNSFVSDEEHRNSNIPRGGSKNCFKGRFERELVTQPKSDRNLENMVSQDPKLNGKLIPTVALESSTDTANSARPRKSLRSTEESSLQKNRSTADRALRTKNPPEPEPGLNRREKTKLYNNRKVELVRVKTRKSFSYLVSTRVLRPRKRPRLLDSLSNMLAPVFADCKLNGASAPRVVLKRLDLDQLLRNGIAPIEPRQDVRKRSIPPNRDLKARIKPRTRLKRIRASRGQGTAKQVNGNHQRRRRTGGQKFEPVPCHEKKWWSSFPLRQVAVRLTKLPL